MSNGHILIIDDEVTLRHGIGGRSFGERAERGVHRLLKRAGLEAQRGRQQVGVGDAGRPREATELGAGGTDERATVDQLDDAHGRGHAAQ